MNKPNGFHNDEDITQAETPAAILERIARHFVGVGASILKALPRLAALSGNEREWLCDALADEAEEIIDAASDLGTALRQFGRQ